MRVCVCVRHKHTQKQKPAVSLLPELLIARRLEGAARRLLDRQRVVRRAQLGRQYVQHSPLIHTHIYVCTHIYIRIYSMPPTYREPRHLHTESENEREEERGREGDGEEREKEREERK